MKKNQIIIFVLAALLWSGVSVATFAATFQTESTADTAAPTISNLRADINITAQTVSIVWQTDEIATSHVSYHKEGSTDLKVNGDLAYVNEHNIVLGALDPLSRYLVVVTSKDVVQNAASASISFETPTDNKADNEDFDGDGMINSDDTDDDNDGMPDSYETAHGFDQFNAKDADQDYDRDGFTNLQEYRAGTDPKNGQDRPQKKVDLTSLILFLLN